MKKKFPSLKGFNRGPDHITDPLHEPPPNCFHPSKGSTVAQTKDRLALAQILYKFPSLKGFNRGPDEQRGVGKGKTVKFPSLKGFNRGPDVAQEQRRWRREHGFHPSKGSTVAQTKGCGFRYGELTLSFHPSKGSTVAQTSVIGSHDLGGLLVSIPQRVQPWPRPCADQSSRTRNLDVSIPQRVQPWPRLPNPRDPADAWQEFPSLKGFNRGPDSCRTSGSFSRS